MASRTVTLRVLFYQEGDQWIAQCVDYDINAHGETIPKAQKAFELAVMSNIIVNVEHQREPFQASNTVPPLFAKAFDDVLATKIGQQDIKVPPNVPPAHMISAIAADNRIAVNW